MSRDEISQSKPHYLGHRNRLRERVLRNGAASLSDYELIEFLLFGARPRADVKPLAKRLLAEFGDLNGVVAASEHRLMKIAGVTDKVYLQLQIADAFAKKMAQAKVLNREVVSSWEALISYCRTSMAHRETGPSNLMNDRRSSFENMASRRRTRREPCRIGGDRALGRYVRGR